MNHKIKKGLITTLSVFACFAPLTACGNDTSSSAQSISVKIDSSCPTYVECGKSIQMLATLRGDDGGLSWSVNDSMIASINEEGLLTGISQGKALVTASSITDPDEYAEIFVDVKYNTLIAVSITSSTSSIKVGQEIQLRAEISGDTTSAGIGWQVNNDALATISSNGTIKAIQVGKEGKVIVNAYSIANPDAVSKNLELSILPSDSGETMIQDEVETHGEYKLIYKDDFSSSRLNTNSWEVMTGTGTKYGVAKGWGNEEKQFYHQDNIKFEDNQLIMTAKKEVGRNDTGGMDFTSARIRSQKKVSYTYGRIEARISCPFGNGLWPAFWMLPDTPSPYGSWPNSGEIDIMEAKGRVKYSIDGTLHYAKADGTHTYINGFHAFTNNETINDYHVYAVEWEEGDFKFYVDDTLYFQSNAEDNTWSMKEGTGTFPAPFDQNFHILLNMAVGGNYDGYRLPSNDELPARYKIDYVKWFQK